MNQKEWIATAARTATMVNKDEHILQVCREREVLDVGCVGQDRNFISDDWLHNKVRKVAKRLVGVDVVEEMVMHLRVQGYDMRLPDELTAADERFDVVLMSEVIEHVDNPVEFLGFYAKFLKPGGVLFVSTPNSNRASNFVNILFNNSYTVNPEHVFWFCPKTMAETARRVPLDIQAFYWADHYFAKSMVKGTYQRFKFFLINRLTAMRKNFSPNMIFILTKNRDER